MAYQPRYAQAYETAGCRQDDTSLIERGTETQVTGDAEYEAGR